MISVYIVQAFLSDCVGHGTEWYCIVYCSRNDFKLACPESFFHICFIRYYGSHFVFLDEFEDRRIALSCFRRTITYGWSVIVLYRDELKSSEMEMIKLA